jgi:NADPH-dependent 2,4-dienoyl-CoA reductase/sulfur reductase-like enzyme
MTRRYLIVGNGPAGVTAAETIRRHDAAGEITIVGDENVAFYSRPGLAYLLTGTIPEKQLFSRPEADYARQRLRRVVGQVLGIDARRHQIDLAVGESVSYDRLLLAVGARALRPEIPGIGLEGVVTLDNLGMLAASFGWPAAAGGVVGGGITAVELAEGLGQRAETHYHRKDQWGVRP